MTQAKHQCSLSAHDLRIGNWVYDGKHTKYPMQVVAIGKDWVHLDFPGNEGDVWEADIKDLQPIEITEEFLINNGFKNDKHPLSLRVVYFNKILNTLAVHLNVHLKYVHELQNLYYIAEGKKFEFII